MTSNVQLSGKNNATGMIFVIGGENFDDFYANLLTANGGNAELTNSTILEAVKIITPLAGGPSEAAVVAAFPGSAPVTPITAAPSYQPSQAAPAPQAPPASRPAGGPPPGQTPPVCDHGYARVWKTGVTKTGPKAGSEWKAWFCPLQKNEGACAAQWA